MSYLTNNYARLPITFSKGQGAWLWDETGKKYLDALSGIAVCGLGHAHPAIAKTIAEQAQTLIHTSNLYHIKLQEDLAQKLCCLSGLSKAFFCNSGTEANEAAIKAAKLYGQQKHIANPGILSFDNGFHGRTLGSLSATANPKTHQGFEPLLENFYYAPFNNIDATESVLNQHDNIIAIMVEPIQGEGGVNLPDERYLQQLRKLCDQHDLLLIVDEIQTGIGRTGHWFANQYFKAQPDIMTLAKGLGNGFPIGACLFNDKTKDLLSPGSHGSTFGGNPLACQAALTTLHIIESESLLSLAKQQGNWIKTQLNQRLQNNANVKEVRGLGLMLGIELNEPPINLAQKALELAILINVAGGSTIRLLPPLIINQQESEQLVATVCELIEKHA